VEILTRGKLERDILGFKVSTFPGRYLEAFTHKSAAHELRRDSYERLEFLGDSCLNLCTAQWLFDKYPKEDEGFMTRLRTRLTCSTTLSNLARSLGLQNYVIFNAKGQREKWYTNARVLEDVLESLIGAVLVCEGLCAARTFVVGLIESIDESQLLVDVNYKDRLSRFQQARGHDLPVYVAEHRVTERGPMFLVSVVVDGVQGRGVDTTKKGAEQKAARALLILLGVPLENAAR
jgi:ribonuclease III